MTRKDILTKKYGVKDKKSLDRLLKYTERSFSNPLKLPLENEQFSLDWSKSFKGVKDISTNLREYIIEANFPIQKGISKTNEYEKAIEEGILTEDRVKGEGLKLKSASVELIDTPAGQMPTITLKDREEFENLIRAISFNNEPLDVPKSMGASTYANYTNWGRIKKYRDNWEKLSSDSSEVEWAKEFSKLEHKKYLYQDRFIILSSSPYSNVKAKDLNLNISKEDWADKSLSIRKYHETTHYFTKRVLGSMKNNAIDEILCDYVGLVKSNEGEYNSFYALSFLGLENYPKYRKGGRLENYLDNLEDKDILIIHPLVKDAISNIEMLHSKDQNPFIAVIAFSKFSLEELATYPDKVQEELEKCNEKYGGKI